MDNIIEAIPRALEHPKNTVKEAFGASAIKPVVETMQQPNRLKPISVDFMHNFKKMIDGRGPMAEDVQNIMLHRTVSSTGKSALNSFESSGIGTHFLVDEAGMVHQSVPLHIKAHHMREDETAKLGIFNNNTVGIEVVGNYNKATKTWDRLNQKQVLATSRLVRQLQSQYGIGYENVIPHEFVQRKTRGEGQVVLDAIKNNILR